MKHIYITAKILRPVLHWINHFKDVGDLLARVWVADVFFKSGLSKIQDWNTTMVLFKYVYSTPLMSPEIAAYIGTGAEFLFPILLFFGLGGRLAILLFFIYNVMCAVSFHFLWTPAGTAGLDDHVLWGLILMLLLFHGPGEISLDHLIHKKYGHLIYKHNDKNGKIIEIK
jgi:putative oxidoreductase